MEALSFLPDVAQTLQQDANANRIKKLLHFTCHGVWEANPSRVAQLDLLELLEELHRLAPTAERLQTLFTDSIKRINKKTEYTQVAELVLAWMLQVYSGELARSHSDNGWDESQAPQPQAWAQVQKIDYSPFDLRLDVIRQTNPLRAKMVLYAALFHPLEANDSSLAVLKQHSLDELLDLFFSRCDTPEDVEAGIRAAAQNLPDASLGSQAAGALIQAMRSLFVYEQPPQYESQTPGGLGQLNSEPEDLGWMEPIVGTNGQGILEPPPPEEPVAVVAPESPLRERTWVKPPPPEPPRPPTPPPLALDGATQRLLDKRGSDLMVTIENTLSELGNQLDERLQEEDPQEYLTLKHQVLRGFLKDVESSSSTFLPILRKWEESEQRLIHPDQELAPAIPDPQTRDPYTSLRRVMVDSALTRRKPELEQEIMRLVKRSIITVKNDIDTALRQLGTELEDSFEDRSLTEGLTLKYTALEAFVHEVERISSKFSSLLTKMEEAERRLFGI